MYKKQLRVGPESNFVSQNNLDQNGLREERKLGFFNDKMDPKN